jgi:hypothetical protein
MCFSLERKVLVLGLIVFLLLCLFILGVLLAAGTVWFQGYIYNEPAEGLIWRGPAAGAALTLVIAIWVALDYSTAGRYRTLFDFSARQDQEYRELLIPNAQGKEDRYLLTPGANNRKEYRKDGGSGKVMPGRPEKIIVKEGDERIEFVPDRDASGNFKTLQAGESLMYRDKKKREMSEAYPGLVSTVRGGTVVGNVLMAIFFFLAWFLCLWLLLRYQWTHALGLAVIFWLVMELVVMPALLDRAETVAAERAVARAESS